MTDYSQFELTARQRVKLAPDEQVFWCGKARPTAWFGAGPLTVIVGAIICAFGGTFMWGVCLDVRKPLVAKSVTLVGCVLFNGFGLRCLLSPLGHWMLTRGSVWAITDRRVVRFFGPFVKSWPREEMLEHVEWTEARHGCRDFAFAEHWVSGKRGGRMVTDSLANVRAEDAPLVEAAFRRLEEITRAAGPMFGCREVT